MAKKKKSSKKNSVSIFRKIYDTLLGNVITELKQVTWTKPQELLQLILFTLVLCGIISAVMMGLDFVFLGIRDSIL